MGRLAIRKRWLPMIACLTLMGTPSHQLLAQPDPPAAEAAENLTGNVDRARIAAVQLLGYDKKELPREGYDPTAEILSYIERASEDRADLVVFPEYVLGHITVPGDETERIGKMAAANRIYVVVGCWENMQDRTFANTALVFDRDGKIAGKYRKTHAAVDNFEGEPAWSRPPGKKDRKWFLENDPEWVMQRGDDLPVFDFDFGRVGILTCYDGWFPESFRVLSLRGAELLLWINGRGGIVEDFIVRSVTFQSHVAVVTTNQAYGGGTMIAVPPAKILAQCPPKEEAYLVSEINLKRLRQIRRSSRNFQQRRPDLYQQLTVGADLVPPTAAQLPEN